MGLVDMFLSIIVPVYNSEDYIDHFLENINNQTVKENFEVIAVDDGSQDNSLQELKLSMKKYAWLKVFSQPNLKQAEARNKGLTHAKGDLVSFLDIDDDIESEFIEKMTEPFFRNANTNWVICGIRKVWQNDRVEDVVENDSVFQFHQQSKLKMTADYLNKNQEMDVGLWNKIFKLSIIKQNELTFKNKNFFEDMLFNLEYFLSIDDLNLIKTIEEPLYTLYKRDSSTTTTYSSDMDLLSDNFFVMVNGLLGAKFNDLHKIKRIMNSLNVRLTIHKLHYHILNDTDWDLAKCKELINNNIVLWKIFGYYDLPIKYRVACLMIKLTPRYYVKMYKKKFM